jgi:hypothetical protein
MSEQEAAAAETPPEAPAAEQGKQGEQGEQQSTPQGVSAEVLAELGIEPDEDGKITLADHTKLLNTVRTLREQAKAHEAAQRKAAEEAEKARVESLSEQERAIEEARKAGYETALSEQREVLVRTQVMAAATAANFADPEDAAVYLNVADLSDEAAVKKAVAKLAEDKPYLLRPAQPNPKLEQGPRSQGKPNAGTGDWLGDALRKKRAG